MIFIFITYLFVRLKQTISLTGSQSTYQLTWLEHCTSVTEVMGLSPIHKASIFCRLSFCKNYILYAYSGDKVCFSADSNPISLKYSICQSWTKQMGNLYPPSAKIKNGKMMCFVCCLASSLIQGDGHLMFHSVGVHKVYLFIHTNTWSDTASTGNYVDFITNYNSFIITQFVLTICLACEGLSLDFAAIAANS